MDDTCVPVGALAKSAGVSVRTLQYYDQIGLLSPNEISEGGRRMYKKSCITRLQQIMVLKYMGFSLEEIKNNLMDLKDPDVIRQHIKKQRENISQEIMKQETILNLLQRLDEDLAIHSNLEYGSLSTNVETLKKMEQIYEILRLYDTNIQNYLVQKYRNNPMDYIRIQSTYRDLVDEAITLIKSQEPPESDKSYAFAAKWWDMVMEYIDGNVELIKELNKFNELKDNWDPVMKEKQEQIDKYLEAVTIQYFIRKNDFTIINALQAQDSDT